MEEKVLVTQREWKMMEGEVGVAKSKPMINLTVLVPSRVAMGLASSQSQMARFVGFADVRITSEHGTRELELMTTSDTGMNHSIMSHHRLHLARMDCVLVSQALRM